MKGNYVTTVTTNLSGLLSVKFRLGMEWQTEKIS